MLAPEYEVDLTIQYSNFEDAINSTRRSAASDCKPMTSIFYEVIRLESADARTCL